MRGKLQWALSLSLVVFLLTITTIGWALLLTAYSLEWVSTKLSVVLNRLIKTSHLNIWLKSKCNLRYADADDATSSHGHQTSNESGSSRLTKNTGNG